MEKIDRQAVLDAIPTNWCDSILTGPDKVVANDTPHAATDIERVLQAVRERILALPVIQ